MKRFIPLLLLLIVSMILSGIAYGLPAAAPIAEDDAYETIMDNNLSVDAPGVLTNDSDPDNDPLTAILVDDSMAMGTLYLYSDGSLEYEPAPGFIGVDVFTYKANDGTNDSNVATITFTVTVGSGSAIFLDEALFLTALESMGFAPIHEGFEEDSAWGSVRTTIPGGEHTAPSVTNMGMTWTANNDTSEITTGPGPVRTGEWGFFSLPHGNYSNNPECYTPGVCTDGWRGSSPQTLVAIGGWIETNTPYAGLILIVDGDTANPIDFGGAILTTQHQFFGYIDPDGFGTFEFRETEGTSEDAKYIFADDFTFAYAAPISVDVPLSGLNIPIGTWAGGNLASVVLPDDAYLLVDSQLNGGGAFSLASTVIVANSPHTLVSSLNVTIEAGADAAGNVPALLRLRNYDTNQWDNAGIFFLKPNDSRRYFLGVPNSNAYIRDSDGQIVAQLLALGNAATFPNGFQMRIDQVEMSVVP